MSNPREEALEHFGVKGMKWGVRRGDSGGGVHSTTETKLKKKKRSRTPAEQAVFDHRVKVGKDVMKAVAIAAGTVAVGTIAGPFVAAGAGAVARTLTSDNLFPTTTIDRSTPVGGPVGGTITNGPHGDPEAYGRHLARLLAAGQPLPRG